MRLFALAAALSLAAPAFSYTKTYHLSYNATYDNPKNSLHSVTCSTGEHGLLTHGYKTFANLPTYPHVGGAPQILSWNSPFCGTCWELTYTDGDGASTSVNFTAIDTSDHDSKSFSISLEGINHITHGQAGKLKSIPITATRKPTKWCLPNGL